MPCCGGNQNLYRQQTWGISAREMGEGGRERWARAEISGTMLQPHFLFIWDLMKLSSMTSRFFASLPCPSTRVLTQKVRSHRGKHKSERGGQLSIPVALYHAQTSLGKVEHRPPTLLSSLAKLPASIFGWWYKQCWQIADKTK